MRPPLFCPCPFRIALAGLLLPAAALAQNATLDPYSGAKLDQIVAQARQAAVDFVQHSDHPGQWGPLWLLTITSSDGGMLFDTDVSFLAQSTLVVSPFDPQAATSVQYEFKMVIAPFLGGNLGELGTGKGSGFFHAVNSDPASLLPGNFTVFSHGASFYVDHASKYILSHDKRVKGPDDLKFAGESFNYSASRPSVEVEFDIRSLTPKQDNDSSFAVYFGDKVPSVSCKLSPDGAILEHPKVAASK
jgi:hypothetical protein